MLGSSNRDEELAYHRTWHAASALIRRRARSRPGCSEVPHIFSASLSVSWHLYHIPLADNITRGRGSCFTHRPSGIGTSWHDPVADGCVKYCPCCSTDI
ncbi:uncharacterized protein An14g04110 [Aspergillus niger]|uniref:Contig An14c0130, genomic contig n=2 Tax=Aspergillus niger TaxID=5061 RepID=A2R3F5_ASPNC|nr:uncharacterized protein An14g04110 [Aspergillus niger]CAK46647.1 unnamed protein product [Aspergillus niger]